MPSHHDARIEVTIFPPMMASPIRHGVEIPQHIYQKTFSPLPRNREIDVNDAGRAIEQQARRQELASRIAQVLAERILAAIESRDTRNGYSPEEWASMHER